MESDDFTNHLRPSNQWSLQNQWQIRQERYCLDNFKNGLFNFEIIYHIKIEFKLLKGTLFSYLELMDLEWKLGVTCNNWLRIHWDSKRHQVHAVWKSIRGWGCSPWGTHSNLFQYSCLENPTDREAWWATVHRVAKSQTWLKWLGMHAQSILGTKICFMREDLYLKTRPSFWYWNHGIFEKDAGEK